MRTIEETREELKRHIDETKCRSCVFGLQELLEFIDSEPPCEHLKVLFWPAAPRWAENLPVGWLLIGQANDTARQKDLVKFCPDCGERLPEDGRKEKA